LSSELDAADLKRSQNGSEYSKATGIVEMISRTPEERRTHDSRLRARRDYLSDIEFARQDGLQKGLERGLEQGLEQGEQIGKIRLLQQLLGEPVSAEADLVGTELTQLRHMAEELQIRLSDRGID
jgi:flagellar biosynthesis/type III secretory pathway protein FliH